MLPQEIEEKNARYGKSSVLEKKPTKHLIL